MKDAIICRLFTHLYIGLCTKFEQMIQWLTQFNKIPTENLGKSLNSAIRIAKHRVVKQQQSGIFNSLFCSLTDRAGLGQNNRPGHFYKGPAHQVLLVGMSRSQERIGPIFSYFSIIGERLY